MNLKRGARSHRSPSQDRWCGGQGVWSRLGREAFGPSEDARPSGRATTDSSERAWAVAFGWRSGDGPSGLEPLAERRGLRAFGSDVGALMVGSASECPEDSVGEMKSMRGVLRSVKGPGSSFEEDGEDQVERPRSRPEKRNQSRSYSKVLDPEGRIKLRERQQRRATGAAHGQRPSGSESPASGHATASRFGGVLDRERGHLRLRVGVVAGGARLPSGSERASEREASAVTFGWRAGRSERDGR